MHSTEAILFAVILAASVIIGAGWGAWSSNRIRRGHAVSGLITVNWALVAAFAAMGVVGAAIFFGQGAFSKIGWTLMICGGVVAVVLAGHHLTLRKLERDAEERRMFVSDL